MITALNNFTTFNHRNIICLAYRYWFLVCVSLPADIDTYCLASAIQLEHHHDWKPLAISRFLENGLFCSSFIVHNGRANSNAIFEYSDTLGEEKRKRLSMFLFFHFYCEYIELLTTETQGFRVEIEACKCSKSSLFQVPLHWQLDVGLPGHRTGRKMQLSLWRLNSSSVVSPSLNK